MMKVFHRGWKVLICCMFFWALGPAVWAGSIVMSDAELDAIVAGTVDPALQEQVMNFHYLGAAGSNHTAEIDGSLIIGGSSYTSQTTGILTIDHGAQSNLSSLVNINAVNSRVDVLLNLNININSTVGSQQQINILSSQ